MSFTAVFCLVTLTFTLCSAQSPIKPINSENDLHFQPPPRDQVLRNPVITDVSAMCAAEGVTAQVMFDGPFFGKIYSKDYNNVHDCVYYNSYDMNMILFTIPNHKCGTRIGRNTVNVVHRIENEVYVQYDKDTQTSEDRRFLFICELASASLDFSATVTPKQQLQINPDEFKTSEPTRIVVTQTGGDSQDSITMEIQVGRGPYNPPVTTPVKLGDLMTLVVKQDKKDAPPNPSHYNMFVHTCYAADGTGQNRVKLIDENGCTARPQVAGRMQRTKTADGETLYYFRISAFKFPGPADVYFTCSVDVCTDCNYDLSCLDDNHRLQSAQSFLHRRRRRRTMITYPPFHPGAAGLFANYTRDAFNNNNDRHLTVYDYVQILDELQMLTEQTRERYMAEHSEHASSSYYQQQHDTEPTTEESRHRFCLDIIGVATIVSVFATLLLITLLVSVYLISVLRRDKLSSGRSNTPYSCRTATSNNSSVTNTISTFGSTALSRQPPTRFGT